MTDDMNENEFLDPRKIRSENNPPPTDDQPGEKAGQSDGENEVPDWKPQRPNALVRHSLRDEAEQLAAQALDAIAILGSFIVLGQLTMIYAAPSSGKTLMMMRLIIQSILSGLINPNALIYVNADDNGKGMTEKVSLLAKVGAHTVVPGYKDFKAAQFVDKLKQMIADGSASGVIVVIDTLKKFTNVMDKARVAEFAQVCREFALAGGTLIALGHTAKNAYPDGTPKYQGTTDIREDFDAVYVGQSLKGAAGSDENIIELTRIKARGDAPERLGYAYSVRPGLTYEEKLETVRELYPEELEGRASETREVADEDVISAIAGYLACGHGHVGVDIMVRAISKGAGFPRAQVRRVLDRYTGPDPEQHRWNFTMGANRKQTYFLLALGEDG